MGQVISFGALNLVLALFFSPLLEGTIRKLKAVVHSRKGPPIIQPYYDLAKLLIKEDFQISSSYLVRLAPVACLSSVLLTALLVPMGTIRAPLETSGDMLVFIYFVSFAAVCTIVAGIASESPYASVGISREVMMLLTVEPVLVICLVTGAVKAHSLRISGIAAWYLSSGVCLSMVIAGVALFLALQAQLGKLPFDIPEADQEIMGGLFIEQSGPKSALFKWSYLAKQIIFTSLFVQVFIPWPRTYILSLDILINLVKVFMVIILVGLIDAVNPRLRIDQALSYFFWLIITALAGLAFALVGA